MKEEEREKGKVDREREGVRENLLLNYLLNTELANLVPRCSCQEHNPHVKN